MNESEDTEGTRALPLKAAYPFGLEHGLQKEIDEIRNMDVRWAKKVKSSVRRGYIIRLFQSKGIFEDFQKKYWPHYSTRHGQTLFKWYLKNAEDYDRFLEGQEPETSDSEQQDEDTLASQFAYETDLRDYLAQHLDILGKGLVLHKDEKGSGVEYPVENGRIDILARDQNGEFLVVELKLSQGRSKTLGQLLYYMGWIGSKIANGRKVRGAIVAREIPEELRLACTRTNDISLFEYTLQVSVRQIVAR